VTLLTFVLFDVVGGSPAAIVLGKNATKEQIAEYDHVHGYDRPLGVHAISVSAGPYRFYDEATRRPRYQLVLDVTCQLITRPL